MTTYEWIRVCVCGHLHGSHNTIGVCTEDGCDCNRFDDEDDASTSDGGS